MNMTIRLIMRKHRRSSWFEIEIPVQRINVYTLKNLIKKSPANQEDEVEVMLKVDTDKFRRICYRFPNNNFTDALNKGIIPVKTIRKYLEEFDV